MMHVDFLLTCNPDIASSPLWIQIADNAVHSGPWTDQDMTNVHEAPKWWLALII